MQVPEGVREQLRKAMEDPNTVGKEIARRIGCSRSTLYEFLNGHAGPKLILRAARALAKPASDPN